VFTCFLRAAWAVIVETLFEPELYRVIGPKITRLDDILRIVEADNRRAKTPQDVASRYFRERDLSP
jgi:hypothetical protein